MKLYKLGSNCTQVSLPDGIEVFFSYNKPVAAFIPGHGYMKSNKFYSRTTSKHVNQWIGKYNVTVVDQKTIDNLV